MIYFIKQLLFILFFYFSFISKAQNTNSLNGYFVLKANMAVFYDNDGRLFYFANPDYGNVNTKYY